MKINWITGVQNWAYKNLVSHLIKAMPGHEHITNDRDGGDADFLVAVDQLKTREVNSKTILHIDGNRWYEKCIKQ